MYNLVKNKISSTLVQLTVHFFNETKRKTNTNYIDVELAGHVHKLDVKLQSLCGSGFSLFAVCMLAKPYHFGVNWSTTVCENKDGVHFFTLKFECHNRYNKSLLCNPENRDIAWYNENNSQWRFCVFFQYEQKPVSCKKKQKNRIKKNRWVVFLLKRVFLNPDCLLFVIFPWSHDLEQVTSISVCLGVRRILRV